MSYLHSQMLCVFLSLYVDSHSKESSKGQVAWCEQGSRTAEGVETKPETIMHLLINLFWFGSEVHTYSRSHRQGSRPRLRVHVLGILGQVYCPPFHCPLEGNCCLLDFVGLFVTTWNSVMRLYLVGGGMVFGCAQRDLRNRNIWGKNTQK